jgi:periplasmic divalent cation tolerance protein
MGSAVGSIQVERHMAAMFVYVTTGDQAEALAIGRAVVERRLAACANVVDGMKSIYWWDGAVQQATEAVLILKTEKDRVEALVAEVKARHSYDCPCIEAIEVAGGNPDFLAWINRETRARDLG